MIYDKKDNKKYNILEFLHDHIIAIIIIIVVIAGGISTVAIIRGDVKPQQQAEKNIEYKEMKTVYLGMDQVKSLNPLVSTDSDVYYVTQLMFSSLFKMDDNLTLEKDIVDTYTTHKTGGYVTINLKKNVKFSDGTNLNAKDVLFTVKQIKDIGTSCPYYSYVSKIDSVKIMGTYKLKIIFNKVTNASLNNLTFPIVCSKEYDTELNKVLGSGQYKYTSYDSNRYLKLSPNTYYFGDVATNKIKFTVLPTKSNISGLMTMDAITANLSTSQNASAIADDKKLNSTSVASNKMEYLGFNFKNKILKNVEVRKAIASSINTEGLINDNYGGSGIASDTIYFPSYLGTENTGDAYPFDTKGALVLMAKAGYVDIDEDGVLEDENGKNLEFTLLVNSNNNNRLDSAYSIADYLGDIGIQVKIKKMSYSNYISAIKRGSFDLLLGGYKFDKNYDLRNLFASNNILSYNNKDVVSLVNNLEKNISINEQLDTYQELKTSLINDIPYYCICYKTYTFMTVKRFTSDQIPTYFNRFRGCSTWRWEKTITNVNDEKQ